MKSSQQIINDVLKKLSLKLKTRQSSLSDDNDQQLDPIDLIPIKFTGMIEDYLFKESKQISDLLQQQNDQDIEGLTYNQIKNDPLKQTYYDKVRLNIPKYYCLKPSDRQKHFKLQGDRYLFKLGVKPDELQNQVEIQSLKKKGTNQRELTPIKPKQTNKKQSKKVKKQQKKNACIIKQQNDNIKDDEHQILCKQNHQNGFNTPQKKQKEVKKVKFFQFEYVKDFSQYKTPKNLSVVIQFIQPLKEDKPQKQQN